VHRETAEENLRKATAVTAEAQRKQRKAEVAARLASEAVWEKNSG
jgi:hypothetical protein